MTALRWCLLAATLSVGSASAQPAPAVITLALDFTGSTPLLAVRVNGGAPGWFIVDSGASTCVLDDALAKRLRLTPVDTGTATGAGKGTVPSRNYRSEAVSFRAGLARFTCPRVISLDLSGQPAILGRRIDGVLGTGFLSQHVVELDYETATLRLHPRDGFEYRGPGESLPLTFENHVPHVVARLTVAGVAPAERTLLIDTGSQDAVDDDLLLQSKKPLAEVEGGVGLGQTYRVSFGSFPQVRLGSFELANVPAVAPGVPLIGGEVLRRFRIFFDYARSRMILEPNPHLRDRFALSAPALQLRGIPGDGAVRVHEIPAQSAAARAGLAPGDLITAVDGTPVADLGFTRLQALLRRAGTFALTVRRAGRAISVVLENPSPTATDL
jgi:Aspartyl protease/PDZ domain